MENEEGMWQDIVRKKYVRNKCIFQIKHKAQDSPIWSDLLKVKEYYMKGRKLIVGNGRNIDFWDDIWLGDFTL